MNVFIRCDGSKNIGTGHVVRMLSLANEFSKKGILTTFITRKISESLIEFIKKRGYPMIVMEDCNDSFTINPQLEEKEITNNIPDQSILIIDHYGYNQSLFKRIKKRVKLLVLIDDFQPDRINDAIDVLINPNVLDKRIVYPKINNQLQLIGPKYALLREQFRLATSYEVKETCQNIMICFGGSDTAGRTIPTLQMLNQYKKTLNITVILGIEYQKRIHLQKEIQSSKHRIVVKSNIYNMAQEMAKQDLLLIPSSTIALEAASLGVPAGIFICENNQRPGGMALHDTGAACLLGNVVHRYDDNDVFLKFKKLANSFQARKKISLQAKKMVNSKGAEVAVDQILKKYGRCQ